MRNKVWKEWSLIPDQDGSICKIEKDSSDSDSDSDSEFFERLTVWVTGKGDALPSSVSCKSTVIIISGGFTEIRFVETRNEEGLPTGSYKRLSSKRLAGETVKYEAGVIYMIVDVLPATKTYSRIFSSSKDEEQTFFVNSVPTVDTLQYCKDIELVPLENKLDFLKMKEKLNSLPI